MRRNFLFLLLFLFSSSVFADEQTDPSAEAPEARAARLLHAHCAICHAGPGEALRLPLEDFAALRSFRTQDDDSVSDLLARKKMPRRSAQVPPLTDVDRAFLIEFLQPL